MLKGGGGRARTTPLPGHAAALFRMHFSSSRMVSIKRVSFQIIKPNPNKKENLLTFFYFLVHNNNPFENLRFKGKPKRDQKARSFSTSYRHTKSILLFLYNAILDTYEVFFSLNFILF